MLGLDIWYRIHTAHIIGLLAHRHLCIYIHIYTMWRTWRTRHQSAVKEERKSRKEISACLQIYLFLSQYIRVFVLKRDSLCFRCQLCILTSNLWPRRVFPGINRNSKYYVYAVKTDSSQIVAVYCLLGQCAVSVAPFDGLSFFLRHSGIISINVINTPSCHAHAQAATLGRM